MTKKSKKTIIRQNIEAKISQNPIKPETTADVFSETLTQKNKSLKSMISMDFFEKITQKGVKELLICLFGIVLAVMAFFNPDKLEEIARVFSQFLG